MANRPSRRAVPCLSVFVLATFFRLAAAPARGVEAEEVGSNREDLQCAGGLDGDWGNHQVSLSWTASAGAAIYNLKRATTSGGSYATIATPSSTVKPKPVPAVERVRDSTSG